MDAKNIFSAIFQKKNITPIAVFLIIVFFRRDFILALLVAAAIFGLRFIGL